MTIDIIKSMERIARTTPSVISLGQGIPSGQMHPKLQDAAIKATVFGQADAYSDPQGTIELRTAIARHAATENIYYSADEVIVTVGAIEAVNVALRSVITASRKSIIIPTPTYSAYFSLTELAGGTVVPHATNADDNWTLDIEQIKQQITDDTAAILLSSPNNPTGTVYDKATLRHLAQVAKDAGIALIIDEVYRHMTFTTEVYSPAEDLEFKQTVIRIMSLSKDFNMTGWRVGYIQAAPQRIEQLVSIHDSLVNCAPVVSQHVAVAAMTHAEMLLEYNKRTLMKRRDRMATWLDRMSDVLEYRLPDAGYFFFARIKTGVDSVAFASKLAEGGVIVIPGAAFGENGEGYVRICFGRSLDAIDGGMERILKSSGK